MGTNGMKPGPSSQDDSNPTEEFFQVFQTVLDDCLQRQSGDSALPAASRIAASKKVMSSVKGHNIRSLIHLHQLVSERRLKSTPPSNGNLLTLRRDVSVVLRQQQSSSVQELTHLLNGPHLSALLSAHDDVANRQYGPVLPEIPTEVDEDEGMAMKIVRLVRNNEPLGATIKCEDTGAVVIARVMKGGVADRSGCIQVGDTVVEVNGHLVAGMQPSEIVKLITENDHTVTFKLIPADDEIFTETEIENGDICQRVRALFDYQPVEDRLHPCPEAGLSFLKGDILELVDSKDQHWWQARLETIDQHTRVGLIPSRQLMEKKQMSTIDSRRSPTRKVMYETGYCDQFEHLEIKSYEDVSLLYPRQGLLRPIVLVGPPGVGRNELKRRLLMLNPDRFGTTVPHTSRRPRSGETDGVDYHFVGKRQMEDWVLEGTFIEYGEYRGNLYGTLTDSVRAVLEQGRVPVLNPHPQALRLLRTPEIKPFIVYVKPPPFPALKETRSNIRVRSTFDPSYGRGFTDDELQQMTMNASHLEQHYGHWFDYNLLNGNLEFAFKELCDVIQRVESQPQWIPSTWIR